MNCSQISVPDSIRDSVRSWMKLSAAIILIAVIWGALLPRYANQPRMKAHLAFLDDNGIDPSAMYYTELEVMDEILQRLEQR